MHLNDWKLTSNLGPGWGWGWGSSKLTTTPNISQRSTVHLLQHFYNTLYDSGQYNISRRVEGRKEGRRDKTMLRDVIESLESRYSHFRLQCTSYIEKLKIWNCNVTNGNVTNQTQLPSNKCRMMLLTLLAGRYACVRLQGINEPDAAWSNQCIAVIAQLTVFPCLADCAMPSRWYTWSHCCPAVCKPNTQRQFITRMQYVQSSRSTSRESLNIQRDEWPSTDIIIIIINPAALSRYIAGYQLGVFFTQHHGVLWHRDYNKEIAVGEHVASQYWLN